MNNTFYFLRHGETKIDKNTPVSKWVLSETGKTQAEKLAGEDIFKDIDLIFSSTEDKAYKTALPLAEKLGMKVIMLENLRELERDKGSFLEPEAYEKIIKQCLKNPNESFNNWETANHALERFFQQVSALNRSYEGKKILIAGHGFTINMYFAKLLNNLDNVYERMKKNDFADWGIVRNQEVIQDIAK